MSQSFCFLPEQSELSKRVLLMGDPTLREVFEFVGLISILVSIVGSCALMIGISTGLGFLIMLIAVLMTVGILLIALWYVQLEWRAKRIRQNMHVLHFWYQNAMDLYVEQRDMHEKLLTTLSTSTNVKDVEDCSMALLRINILFSYFPKDYKILEDCLGPNKELLPWIA